MKTLEAPLVRRVFRGIAPIRTSNVNVVTGAFGYTGKYITRELLSRDERVTTLTSHSDRRNLFNNQVSIAPLRFDDPDELTKSLRGADVLFNTYWVRFPHGQVSFDKAVENTRILIRAAENAGVRRIVHISVMKPSEQSPLPYFKGKALVEKAIMGSTLSHAIIRPTVIFGIEDILINNIAWLLRRFPIFAVPGSGNYKIRPVFAGDVAKIAVAAAYRDDNMLVEAIGPEIYTFNELVHLTAQKVCSKAKIVHVPSGTALILAKLIGQLVRDVVLTEDEARGLMANLLVSGGPSTGQTSFAKWLEQNADILGSRYASELGRHYR